MRALNIYFEDADFEKLKQDKGKLSWRAYILKFYNEKQRHTR